MRAPWRILGVAAVAALAALACPAWQVPAGRGGEAEPAPLPDPVREGVFGLLYTLGAGGTATRPGELLDFKLTILNQGPDPVVFEFPSGQEFDFTVTRDGAVVWQWSRGRRLTDPAARRELGPGEALVYTSTWSGRDDRGLPLEPGPYEVRAVFLGEADGVRLVGPLTVVLH